MDEQRRGLKLIEVMAIVLIIGLVMGTAIPAIKSARESSRQAHCRNNMRNLGLCLVEFSSTKNHYPNAGTFYDDPEIHGGDPSKSNIYRAIVDSASFAGNPGPLLHSWVWDISPYLDYDGLYDAIDREKGYLDTTRKGGNLSNRMVTTTSIPILRCPDDPTPAIGQGNLSYVVNGGFVRWYAIPVSWMGSAKDGQSWNGDVLHWADEGNRLYVGRKLGVMFLGTQTGDQPWDMKTRLSDITDGASNTLLLGENTLAGYSSGTRYSGGLPTNWACPLPNFTMFLGSDDVCRSKTSETDCLAGQLKPTPSGQTGEGWSWASRMGSFERIGFGDRLTVEGSFPYVNSGHPDGNNFVFCDGSVRFLSHTIDGKVYASMITPAGGSLPEAIRQTTAIDPSSIDP